MVVVPTMKVFVANDDKVAAAAVHTGSEHHARPDRRLVDRR